ncbi:MAG: hypothetical protein VW600_11900 [Ferrovibrio sp.]
MLLSADQTILISIDIQERLLPAIHDGARVQRNAEILLRAAQATGPFGCRARDNP